MSLYFQGSAHTGGRTNMVKDTGYNQISPTGVRSCLCNLAVCWELKLIETLGAGLGAFVSDHLMSILSMH